MSVVLLLSFARRGEEGAIRSALELITQESPAAEVIAFGTPASRPVFQKLGIENVLVFGEGRSRGEVIADAKERRPTLALIVYSGPGARGHLKLEALALSVPVPRVYRFVPGEPMRVTSRFGLACAAVGKALQAAACLAAGGLICAAAWVWLRAAQLLTGGRHARRP